MLAWAKAAAARKPSSTWWRSSRARPSPRRCSKPTCSRHESLDYQPGAPRRAVRDRRGRVDRRREASARTTAASRCASATKPALARAAGFGADRPDGAVVEALRAHLERAGASFWPDLVRARPARPTSAPCSPRCGTWCGPARSPTTGLRRRAGRARPGAKRDATAAKGRPRPGRLTRLGPPAGRRALVTRRAVARAGAVTHRGHRGAGAAAAGPPRHRHPRSGAGRRDPRRIRRGVPRAAHARGSRPGAPRLLHRRARRGPVRAARRRRTAPRASRPDRIPSVLVLAATDPRPAVRRRARAGPSLPTSMRRRRRAPAAARAESPARLVVLRDGAPVAFLDPRGHHVLAFDVDDSTGSAALPALVHDGRVRRLEIQRVNGVTVRTTPFGAALEPPASSPPPAASSSVVGRDSAHAASRRIVGVGRGGTSTTTIPAPSTEKTPGRRSGSGPQPLGQSNRPEDRGHDPRTACRPASPSPSCGSDQRAEHEHDQIEGEERREDARAPRRPPSPRPCRPGSASTPARCARRSPRSRAAYAPASPAITSRQRGDERLAAVEQDDDRAPQPCRPRGRC